MESKRSNRTTKTRSDEPVGLAQMGMIGWEPIEPIVVAALAAHLPILFVGYHGTTKTDGAAVLARSALGDAEARFVSYLTPMTTLEDMIGFVDPSSLASGQVRYVRTGTSVWGAKAVLMDEINRANPMTVSKFMELVRTGQVLGTDTGVQHVFGACNPTRGYRTSYLDLAFASRWVIVEVPGIAKLTDQHVDTILEADTFTVRVDFAGRLAGIRAHLRGQRRTDLDGSLRLLVRQVLRKLHESGLKNLNVQARQGRNMLSLLRHYCADCEVRGVAPRQVDMTDILMACIPEVQGVCEAQVAGSDVAKIIKPMTLAVQHPSALAEPTSIQQLIETVATRDKNAWGAQAVQLIGKTKIPIPDLHRFSQVLRRLLLDGEIAATVFNEVYGRMVAVPGFLADDTPIGWDRSGLIGAIRNT